MNTAFKKKPDSIAGYIEAAPEEFRQKLHEMYICLRKAAPAATEGITRKMPAFSYGWVLFTFAARKNYIGFYTFPWVIRKFQKELAPWKRSAQAVQFPPDQPLPLSLLRKMAGFSLREAQKYQVPRDSKAHKQLALKAANEARQVLALFEKENPGDQRPREAIRAIQDWAEGKRQLGLAEVRRLSLASHASARQAKTEAARFAARAAGHAVATWHVPRHAQGAEEYSFKAKNTT